MIELVYICSAARSGSTLLNLMIGTHPRVLPAGEVARLSKSIALNTRCSCGEAVRTCDFWKPVVDRLSDDAGVDLWNSPYSLDLGFIRAVSEVDHNRQTPLYLWKRLAYMAWLELLGNLGVDPTNSALATQYQHWLDQNLKVHDALRARSGRQIVVDSSKAFRLAAGFYRNRPDGTRIILLSRDGRGVISSYLRSGSTLRSSVRRWAVYYERALKWMRRNVKPEHVLRVCYEDLVLNPSAELDRIFRFLDLPSIEGIGDIKPMKEHILEGNKNTLRSTEVRLDERWRSELSESQMRYFLRVGGDLMKQLGYTTSRTSPVT